MKANIFLITSAKFQAKTMLCLGDMSEKVVNYCKWCIQKRIRPVYCNWIAACDLDPLGQGFSNFFPGNPNFSIQILCDPKQKKC